MAVIGAGVMGTATARALARSGRKVILLERFQIGHARGSSHGRARIFRLSYKDPMYVEMAQEALPMWRDLEKEVNEQILVTTGGLDVGEGIGDNGAALEKCGVPHEWLHRNEVEQRFPVTRSGHGTALYQPDAGVIAADRAVQSLLASARTHGAEIQEGTRVEDIVLADDLVRIPLGLVEVQAQVAVVTAGGWANDLLAPLDIHLPVRVTRETVGYFNYVGDAPPTVVQWGDPTIYALPSPGQGLKAGQHIAGPEIDPDSEGTVDRASLDRVSRWVDERFPNADSIPGYSETCIYTNTDDESFILERHGRIVVGSPCSGHGFKFAPLIGKRLAALAEEAL